MIERVAHSVLARFYFCYLSYKFSILLPVDQINNDIFLFVLTCLAMEIETGAAFHGRAEKCKLKALFT